MAQIQSLHKYMVCDAFNYKIILINKTSEPSAIELSVTFYLKNTEFNFFKNNYFQVVITIFAHIQFIYTKPISVPVVWPDNAGSNTNFNREPRTQPNRRIEAINDRPNSDFNRLVFNRVGHNLQNDNSQGYTDFVDRPERLTNNFAVQGGSSSNLQTNDRNKLVFDDVESRTKFLIKKKLKKKKKKKKICIPIGYGHGKADSLRTLYDFNVIFADVNVNEYDTVGGYGCKPFYGQSGGHGSHHGTHGGHGSNHHTSSHHGSTNHGTNTGTDTDSATDSDYDYVNQNDHGSLIQTDDYDHESNVPNHVSESGHGSHNLFGGLFHGNPSHNYNQGSSSSNYNHGNGYASGGPFGFFGQGGLFDFSNNGGQRPQASGPLGDSIDDTVKPVIEINVPDTIQDVVSLIQQFFFERKERCHFGTITNFSDNSFRLELLNHSTDFNTRNVSFRFWLD